MPFNDSIKNYVAQLKNKQSYAVFIETGTNIGDTALWAAPVFDKVFTCEPGEALFKQAQKNLSGYSNVDVRLEITEEFLPNILPSLEASQEKCVFWLDAHYSAGITFGVFRDNPALAELETINSYKLNEPIILIDDLRLFVTSPGRPGEYWATVKELENKFLGKEYAFIAMKEQDIIAIVPKSLQSITYNTLMHGIK